MIGSMEDATQALDGIRAAERRLAVRAHWSMARHLAFAGLIAAMVAALALPTVVRLLLTVGLIVIALLIARRDKARDGMFVNGWRSGRTFWVSLGSFSVIVALALGAGWAAEALDLWWAPLAAAAIVLPVSLGASLLWEYVYREELGA